MKYIRGERASPATLVDKVLRNIVVPFRDIERSPQNPYSAGTMKMRTGAGELLSNDLKKVLDLLEYRFDVRQASSEISNLKNKVVISIEFEDLKRVGMEAGPFISALHRLVEQFPEIEIVYVFDFVDEIPKISGPARALVEISSELHGISFKSTLADLIVPLQFKHLLNKARGNKASKSTHIVIDDTPEGANWPSLHLRFTNGRTLLASFPMSGWHKSIGAGELGLEKIGSTRPKEQWLLLEEAAQSNGQIKLPANGKTKESKRRQINALQHLLNAVFPNLNGQPFESCGGDTYQTLFVIEPEQHEE